MDMEQVCDMAVATEVDTHEGTDDFTVLITERATP